MPAPCTKLASNRKIATPRPSPSLPLLLIGFVFSNPKLRQPRPPFKAPIPPRSQTINGLALFFQPRPARLRLGSFFQIALHHWLRSVKSPPSHRLPSQLGSFFQIPHPGRPESVWVRFFNPAHPPSHGFVFSNPPRAWLRSAESPPTRAPSPNWVRFFKTTPANWLRSAECLRSVLRPCGQYRSAPYNGYFPCV